MKVLWVVNKLTGALHEKVKGKKSTGGLWLEAMLDSAKLDADIEIVAVNIQEINEVRCLDDGNIKYYTIPGRPTSDYDYKSEKSQAYWKYVIDIEKPDLIELWGTEMPFGLAVLKAAPQLPCVVYVQGVLESIGRYYRAGIPQKDLRKCMTLRDVFSGETICKVQKQYLARSKYEIEIVRQAKNIIVENDWAEAYYKSVVPEIKVYRCPLSISDEFSKEHWDDFKMVPYTVMCPAANYPIKGLHMLLKALSIVKRQYPEIKLTVPGTPLKDKKSIKDFLKERGYDRYIRHLIDLHGLKDNVIYLGRLTAAEMAQCMSRSNCFVMCSAIENHSSTLKEAMTVGVPSVASYVGGVPEYAEHKVNTLLYRFEDYEMLAFYIIKLFESTNLCKELSVNARQCMELSRVKNDFYQISKTIYSQILINAR